MESLCHKNFLSVTWHIIVNIENICTKYSQTGVVIMPIFEPLIILLILFI